MKCRKRQLYVERVTSGDNVRHSAVVVFVLVSRVFGPDDFEARLAREGATRASSVDEAHHTVGGMLPAKQPLPAPGYVEGRERWARLVWATPGIDKHRTVGIVLLTVRRCLVTDGLKRSAP